MANKKISQLTASAPLSGSEEFPIVQGGNTVKSTIQDIANFTGTNYKKYVAILTQTGTSNPSATVLENTLDDNTIVFVRQDFGLYSVEASANTFTSGKTAMLIVNNSLYAKFINLNYVNDSTLNISVFTNIGDPEDVFDATVEIRVYP